MNHDLFSLRMHAAEGGRHLSGAERLVSREDLEAAASELLRRALHHCRGAAEQIRLSVDLVPHGSVCSGRLPDLRTLTVKDAEEGRQVARRLLHTAGVADYAAAAALEALAGGAAPGGENMRGAMLVTADGGHRCEPDPRRGVRVSRMDLTSELRGRLRSTLATLALDNEHVVEALTLAGKVVTTSGIVAELCWSDDPDYTAGYVCAPASGYVRLPHLKPYGDRRGGRAFFLRPGTDVERLIEELERRPVLFDSCGICHPAIPWRDYAPFVATGA
jgi:6-carboxyhexanoate--CoA ligase